MAGSKAETVKFNTFMCEKCGRALEVPEGIGAPICCGGAMKKLKKEK